jgi:glycosyltransferase involved in cell wall biosynthesis
MARVAVIIPTYNYSAFLETALRSIYAQTVAPAEIIVVDDGSDEDDPAEVLARHPGVRLIRQKHLGLGAARNTGWWAASSEFLVFLDADDRLKPEAIAHNLEQFEAHPGCGLVFGGFCNVRASTGDVIPVPMIPPDLDQVASFLRGNLIQMHGAVMYRREALEKLGGFDPTLPACEDYDLYIRAVFSFRVACRPEVIAEYVRHDRNMSRDAGMMLEYALAVLRRYEPLARERPEWLAALREGEVSLRDAHVTDWIYAYRRAPAGPGRSALRRQGWRVAPLTVTRVGLAMIARGAARRLGRILTGKASRPSPSG